MSHPYRTSDAIVARRWRLRPRLRAWRRRRVIFFARWVKRLREMDFDEAWRTVAFEIILLLTA